MQKRLVEMMCLCPCGDVSVKKGHKLIIRLGCEGMLRIKALLLLLEYPELIGNQKDSQCFNSVKSQKIAKLKEQIVLIISSCHDCCHLLWIAYQFYTSLSYVSRPKTLMLETP